MNIAGDFFLTIIYMKLIMKKLESYLFKFIPGRSPETARFTGLLLVEANIERIDVPTAHNISLLSHLLSPLSVKQWEASDMDE